MSQSVGEWACLDRLATGSAGGWGLVVGAWSAVIEPFIHLDQLSVTVTNVNIMSPNTPYL